MKEIELTQNQVALVDDEDFEYLNQFRWHALKSRSTFYAVRKIRLINRKQIAIRMHRQILNTPKGMETDHINHCGLDNRRANIRVCTASENHMNSNSRKGSTSKFKGVHWDKNSEKWRARIQYNGENKHLGYFPSETEASLAYNKKALELFGEFANSYVV